MPARFRYDLRDGCDQPIIAHLSEIGGVFYDVDEHLDGRQDRFFRPVVEVAIELKRVLLLVLGGDQMNLPRRDLERGVDEASPCAAIRSGED